MKAAKRIANVIDITAITKKENGGSLQGLSLFLGKVKGLKPIDYGIYGHYRV